MPKETPRTARGTSSDRDRLRRLRGVRFTDTVRLRETLREICLSEYANRHNLAVQDAELDVERVREAVQPDQRPEEDREAEKIVEDLVKVWGRAKLLMSGGRKSLNARFLDILEGSAPYLEAVLGIVAEAKQRARGRTRSDSESPERQRLVERFGGLGGAMPRSDQELATISVLIGIPTIETSREKPTTPAQLLFREAKAVRSARLSLLKAIETAKP
jgi:hypothetical protein